MKAFATFAALLASVLLPGCATIKVRDAVQEVALLAPGHLEWWNDSAPRVIELPRVCDGDSQEFLVPGPRPAVHLRLDAATGTALFHDGPPACRQPVAGRAPLRLIVSRDLLPLEGPDSVLLLGRMDGQDPADPWYSLGKDPDSTYGRNACAQDAWCMRPGAVLRWRTGGRILEIPVRETLHPEHTLHAVRQRRIASLGYLVSVPLDIVLSPVYLVGGAILYFALRDVNPWH
jgi:hypothetical protein